MRSETGWEGSGGNERAIEGGKVGDSNKGWLIRHWSWESRQAKTFHIDWKFEQVCKYNYIIAPPKASWAGSICRNHSHNITTASDCQIHLLVTEITEPLLPTR